MKRQAKKTFDTFSVQSNIYNEYAGGQKNLTVGPFLTGIQTDAGIVTDASTSKRVGYGASVAIFNNSATLASARFGATSAVAVGAVGSVDVDGNVSVPLLPNSWTYLASGEKDWLITSASTCLVFIIKDETEMVR
jgi:hypothetical protein